MIKSGLDWNVEEMPPQVEGNDSMRVHGLTNASRRRTLGMLIGSLFTGACAAKSMKVSLDVVLFSYLDRPIFDVFIGNEEIGMAGPYPHSGTGTVTGVPLMLGAQEVRWRLDGPPGMAGNGDTVRAANTVRLDSVPADARYLAVHIFPDNTVELACSRFFPELTARGEAFDQKWQRTHGG